MHTRQQQLSVLVLFLALFIGFGLLNTYLIYHDIQLSFSVFGFSVSNTSNASNSATGVVCITHPVNIASIPDQSATSGTLFQYTVNATQSDGHAITFTDDTELFTINPSTGLISFTPTDAGSSLISITAIDNQSCFSLNDSTTFTLTITAAQNVTNATSPPCTGHCGPQLRPGPPGPLATPPPPIQQIQAPYFVLTIRDITINGQQVYSQYNNIQMAEYGTPPNTLLTITITVRNIGFNDLSNVHIDLPLPPDVKLLSLNPPNLAHLNANQEYTFTAQIQVGQMPFTFVANAKSDQDSDTRVIPITFPPNYEKPQFGFEVPPWLPLFIAIPLLFFLGYSVLKNEAIIRQFLQELFMGLLAFLLRRTSFIDEDMLRTLIKAKKLNKFLHLHVVPDVYARYHPQYKNLRMRELKREDYDNVAILIRQYLIAGEMATLITMTTGKPHPRIMTRFIPSKKLADDYKRIKFYNPVKRSFVSEEKSKVQVDRSPQKSTVGKTERLDHPPHSL